MNIACIVEGHGECEAVPLLLRRLAAWRERQVAVKPPIRLPRGRIVRHEELVRAIRLAAKLVAPRGAILILLDADDDCPAELGPRLQAWAQAERADLHISAVLPNREFEAWFLAGAASLAGRRGLPADLQSPIGPESVRDAKGWLAARMGRPYSSRLDQCALAALLDLETARIGSASFDKLVREFDSWC